MFGCMNHLTYINDFQRCWIKAFALLHNFTMDRFINLIAHKLEAQNVVLNFCGEKVLLIILRNQTQSSEHSDALQLTLHGAFVFVKSNLLVDDPFGTINGNFL